METTQQRDTTLIDAKIKESISKLGKLPVTVDLILYREVEVELPPRKPLKQTDRPSNWDDFKTHHDYDFESWRQSKIDAGLWKY